jgi:hypothetical protein
MQPEGLGKLEKISIMLDMLLISNEHIVKQYRFQRAYQ